MPRTSANGLRGRDLCAPRRPYGWVLRYYVFVGILLILGDAPLPTVPMEETVRAFNYVIDQGWVRRSICAV